MNETWMCIKRVVVNISYISLEAETEKGVVSLIIFRALLEVLANLSTKLAEIWDI